MRIDREEQAKHEVGNTNITRRTAIVFTVFFLVCISLLPFVQAVHEAAGYAGGRIKTFLPSVFGLFSKSASPADKTGETKSLFSGVMEKNEILLGHIVRYEDDLENDSIFRDAVIPPTQSVFTGLFKLGNEKAVIGREGWLFYEPGLHYLTSWTGLDALNVNRSSSKANTIFFEKKAGPAETIIDFGRQLNERGIQLVLLPAPVKPMFYADKLSARLKNSRGYLQNPVFEKMKREFEQNNILVFDAAALINSKQHQLKSPSFLRTDTHWSPEVVELLADELAGYLEENIEMDTYNYNPLAASEKEISNTGDIANMLKLCGSPAVKNPETVKIRQVLQNTNEPWVSDRTAEILFLGDSFANIYSLDSMGWGESAGIIEQLSWILDRPVDRIVQNDNGAWATRQALQYELLRGRDRLEGKKVVIWEFALRELAVGDWKKLEMKPGNPEPSSFYIPGQGGETVVSGIILEASSRPVPGTTPYRDHIMTFHLVDVNVEGQPRENLESLVYVYSMIDYELTNAAAYRPGQKITLRLQNWYDVEEKYNSINRAEIDNDELMFEDPCWAVEVIE